MVHEVFEGEEPETVGLGFAEEGHGGAAVEAEGDARGARELGDAVQRAAVESASAVGLGLQADADVFNGRGENCIGDSREGSCGVVLAVAERLGFLFELVDGFVEFGGVLGFECSAGVVETSELDGDAGADSNQWGEGAFVEG